MADSQRKTANLVPEIRSANGWVVGYLNAHNGSYNPNNYKGEWLSPNIPLTSGETITISAMPISYPSMSVYYWNGSTFMYVESANNYSGSSFTAPPNTTHIRFAIRAGSDNKTEEAVISSGFWIMMNTGSTPHPYEPYGWQHSLRKLTTATEAVENPLYSDGTAITNYTIKGNTVQNGTPTPSNPVDVSGVGVRTENWFDKNATNTSNGYADNYRLNSGVPDVAVGNFITEYIEVEPSETYTISGFTAGWSSSVSWYDSNYTLIGYKLYENRSATSFTVPSNAKYIRFTGDMTKKDVTMLNTGSTAKPHEPHGYKIPILSGGVTTNIYLGSTQTTRQIGKYIFDGSNIFTTQRSAYRNNTALFATTVMAGTGVINRPSMNNYFVVPSSGINPQNFDYACSGFHTSDQFSSYYYLRVPYDVIGMTDSNTNNEFITALNTWLSSLYNSGNPMIAYYALATPETAAVNEPLMKIGDYADTLSNATAIPTTEGANSITVDTTVQPSEFTATWTGWHDASVKEKSENYLDENDFGLVEVAAGTYRVGTDVGVLPSGKYTFNAVKSSSAVQIYRTTKNGSTYNYEAISELPYTFTADGASNQIFRSAGNTGSSWAGLGYSDIMLSTGETVQTYEPYWQ